MFFSRDMCDALWGKLLIAENLFDLPLIDTSITSIFTSRDLKILYEMNKKLEEPFSKCKIDLNQGQVFKYSYSKSNALINDTATNQANKVEQIFREILLMMGPIAFPKMLPSKINLFDALNWQIQMADPDMQIILQYKITRFEQLINELNKNDQEVNQQDNWNINKLIDLLRSKYIEREKERSKRFDQAASLKFAISSLQVYLDEINKPNQATSLSHIEFSQRAIQFLFYQNWSKTSFKLTNEEIQICCQDSKQFINTFDSIYLSITPNAVSNFPVINDFKLLFVNIFLSKIPLSTFISNTTNQLEIHKNKAINTAFNDLGSDIINEYEKNFDEDYTFQINPEPIKFVFTADTTPIVFLLLLNKILSYDIPRSLFSLKIQREMPNIFTHAWNSLLIRASPMNLHLFIAYINHFLPPLLSNSIQYDMMLKSALDHLNDFEALLNKSYYIELKIRIEMEDWLECVEKQIKELEASRNEMIPNSNSDQT